MITDEMVEVALFSFDPSFKNPGIDERHVQKWKFAMRHALTAVLPMIRAEVLEEAAKSNWQPDQWLGFGKVD